MKKNLTKKLMLSVLTLAFAVVSLGASTFAWFTTSKDADIEQYSAQVVGGSGIEIAVGTIDTQLADGQTAYKSGYYVNTLPLEELKEVIETRHGFQKLTNVTALATGTEEGLTFDTAGKVNLYNISKNQVSSKDGFIAFKLYAKTTYAAGTLSLDNIKLTAAETPWTSGVEHKNGKGDTVAANAPVNYNILDALRIVVISSVVEDDAVQTTNYYERAENGVNSLDFSKNGAYEIYNKKNSDTEGNLNTGVPALLPTLPSWKENTKAFNEADTGFSNPINYTVSGEQELVFEVYLWLEGYDAECVNALFSSKFTLDISFAYTE